MLAYVVVILYSILVVVY